MRETTMTNGDPVSHSPIPMSLMLRKASIADAATAARLVYEAWGEFAMYMFCQPDEAAVIALLARLFVRRDHRMSYEHATLAEDGDGPKALLMAIPGSELRRLTWRLVDAMIDEVGSASGLRFAWRWWPFLLRSEAAGDQMYIDTLSVVEAWRSRGVGSALLAEAERQARERGLRACSLSVDLSNPSAQRLYERRGYQVSHTFRSARYARAANYPGFHHMVMPLTERKL